MDEQEKIEDINEEEVFSDLTDRELSLMQEDRLKEIVGVMEDVQSMMSTPGWKCIENIVNEELKLIKEKEDDESLSMEETFSCKHKRHGVKLIIDAVDNLVNLGIEARALLLNNPTLEPSK